MLLDYRLLETPAALALSGSAFKVLIYLFKRHNGKNNGQIAFGARSGCFKLIPDPENPGKKILADVHIGLKASATSAALFELERAGFIRCTKESTFDQKRLAREWRVTWLPCNGEVATKEFEVAQGSFKRPKRQKPVRQGAQSEEIQCASAHIPPPKLPEEAPGSAPERTVGMSDSAAGRTHLVTISSDSEGAPL